MPAALLEGTEPGFVVRSIWPGWMAKCGQVASGSAAGTVWAPRSGSVGGCALSRFSIAQLSGSGYGGLVQLSGLRLRWCGCCDSGARALTRRFVPHWRGYGASGADQPPPAPSAGASGARWPPKFGHSGALGIQEAMQHSAPVGGGAAVAGVLRARPAVRASFSPGSSSGGGSSLGELGPEHARTPHGAVDGPRRSLDRCARPSHTVRRRVPALGPLFRLRPEAHRCCRRRPAGAPTEQADPQHPTDVSTEPWSRPAAQTCGNDPLEAQLQCR